MDFKYSLDDADLSVGLSVTCSTTTDDSYCQNGPYEVSSSYSSFMLSYTPENSPPSNNKSGTHIPDLSQGFVQNELDNSFNQSESLKSGKDDFVSKNNYEFVTKKVVVSKRGNKSSSHRSLKNVHSEDHKMQVCKTCGKTFKFQTSLLRHNNKVHFSRYQCLACSRVFSRQSYLDVHTSKPGTSCFIQQKVKSKRRKRKNTRN